MVNADNCVYCWIGKNGKQNELSAKRSIFSAHIGADGRDRALISSPTFIVVDASGI